MTNEKIIKKQAKDSLKNNWSIIISAIIAVCIVFILIQSSLYCFGFFAKAIDTDTGLIREGKQLLFTVASCVALTVAVFISPLINGIFKQFCNLTLYGHAEITDLFYFFKGGKRYFKTLFLNIILLFIFSVTSFGLDTYSLACNLLGASLNSGFSFEPVTLLLIVFFIISVIIKIVLYLIFVHFPLCAYSFNDSLPILSYLGTIGVALRNFGKTIRLVTGFFGWIALSWAFIVPAFYALPYLLTSMTTSAKWLFALERNRGVI